ncbi:MAG: hypothetical protein ACLQGP_35330 [Isosphaeraceae bacterium]
MTIRIELEPEGERALRERARQSGRDPVQYARQIIRDHIVRPDRESSQDAAIPAKPTIEDFIDHEFVEYCSRMADEDVTLDEVLEATSSIKDSMSRVIVTAGALLQFWLSRRMMVESRQSEQVSRAYADYLLGVAGVAQSQHQNDGAGIREGFRQLTDVKIRVAVYGDSRVITAMATFERLGARLATPEQQKAFVSIIEAMRKTGANQDESIAERDVHRVIFGNDG